MAPNPKWRYVVKNSSTLSSYNPRITTFASPPVSYNVIYNILYNIQNEQLYILLEICIYVFNLSRILITALIFQFRRFLVF